MAYKSDLQMFPDCSDVVRVGTERWIPLHDQILQKLLGKVRRFLSKRPGIAFEQLWQDFENNDVRLPVGDQFVYIMYGPEPLFVTDGELNTDIKGLVFIPRTRISRSGTLVVDV